MSKYKVTRSSPTLTKPEVKIVRLFVLIGMVKNLFNDEVIKIERW